jgi:meso-butanediol dehydrogenase/(S,S)-butanediol dehydrogenase/diacetyl reductase
MTSTSEQEHHRMTSHGNEKIAIVTGAGRGTGKVVAQRLHDEGYAVVLGDVDADSAKGAAAEIARGSDRTLGLHVDVSRRESVEQFIAAAVDQFGGIDVLINNAGVISFFPFAEIPEDEWERNININLKGVFLCSQVALPHLLQRGTARIVNIASDVGKRGQPLLAHYVASKFGVVGLTQTLALEVAKKGLTVNAICPTVVNTPMMHVIAEGVARNDGGDVDTTYEHLADVVPVGRPAEPTDIAHTVSWLVSDGAEFITGQSINVTGGSWMH